MRKYLLITMLGLSYIQALAQLSAKFTAQECAKEVYRQGFDSEPELEGWDIESTNGNYTWHLDNSKKVGIPGFQSINTSSTFSMAVFYTKDAQDEVLTSPEFTIQSDGYCSFYACFDGVFVMWANFTMGIIETESEKQTTLFDAFAWSQESGHEKPKWLPFSFDLKEYAGKKVRFVFTYKGSDGDDVLIDDFRIYNKSDELNAKAEIAEGNAVHFEDMSAGNPVAWEWVFEGGTPSVSAERNPVITYNQAGSYPVKLTVKSGSDSSTSERNGFVVVKAVAPVAIIGLPQGGYLSPYAGYFLPVNKDFRFSDRSLNRPAEWLWKIPGSSQTTSSEQFPVVSYLSEGTYDLSLEVSNVAGRDLLEYQDFIQAGGTQHIWNIEIEEADKISSVPLGWYGYYGGTNWLGMVGFAELFDKPATEGSISEVAVFFDKASTITPDTLITLSIAKVSRGLPGEVIAATSVKAKDLKYDPEQWLATDFKFREPVEVADSFFVLIEGIPNQSGESGADEIAIAATTTRPDDGKSTVYHLLQEWDENDKPTGRTDWLKNTDEFLSFAIAPKFTFKDLGSYVETVTQTVPLIYWNKQSDYLYIDKAEGFDRVAVYHLTGKLVYDHVYGSGKIYTKSWQRGTYVIKLSGTRGKFARKIILE